MGINDLIGLAGGTVHSVIKDELAGRETFYGLKVLMNDGSYKAVWFMKDSVGGDEGGGAGWFYVQELPHADE